MENSSGKIQGDILMATESLAETLLHSEPIWDYHQAKARLDTDPQARSLLERLSSTQNEFRVRQSNNNLTQEDIDSLRELQRQVQANELIMRFSETQQDAIACLVEVNKEISQLLGFDFAGMAGPGSC